MGNSVNTCEYSHFLRNILTQNIHVYTQIYISNYIRVNLAVCSPVFVTI